LVLATTSRSSWFNVDVEEDDDGAGLAPEDEACVLDMTSLSSCDRLDEGAVVSPWLLPLTDTAPGRDGPVAAAAARVLLWTSRSIWDNPLADGGRGGGVGPDGVVEGVAVVVGPTTETAPGLAAGTADPVRAPLFASTSCSSCDNPDADGGAPVGTDGVEAKVGGDGAGAGAGAGDGDGAGTEEREGFDDDPAVVVVAGRGAPVVEVAALGEGGAGGGPPALPFALLLSMANQRLEGRQVGVKFASASGYGQRRRRLLCAWQVGAFYVTSIQDPDESTCSSCDCAEADRYCPGRSPDCLNLGKARDFDADSRRGELTSLTAFLRSLGVCLLGRSDGDDDGGGEEGLRGSSKECGGYF
jgi:hypothetical protein